jgi:hypothetical protein
LTIITVLREVCLARDTAIAALIIVGLGSVMMKLQFCTFCVLYTILCFTGLLPANPAMDSPVGTMTTSLIEIASAGGVGRW